MVKSEKILIGCPVRNRAWVLPRYLQALKNLDYNHYNIEYCFIVNDSTDNTLEIIKEFRNDIFSPVKIIICNLQGNTGHQRGYYSFFHLAILRNILLDELLKSDCEYLLSVDSDIILPPNAIKSLREVNGDIVSALVCNGHEIGDKRVYNILNRKPDGRYEHIRDFPPNQIFEVDCTGAAYLIKREVIEKYRVRYSAARGSEDIGFCEDAKAKGRKIYCNPQIEARHEMIEGG